MCNYAGRDAFVDTSRWLGWGPAPEVGTCDYPDFCPGVYGSGCDIKPRLMAKLPVRPRWKDVLAEIADKLFRGGQELIPRA